MSRCHCYAGMIAVGLLTPLGAFAVGADVLPGTNTVTPVTFSFGTSNT